MMSRLRNRFRRSRCSVPDVDPRRSSSPGECCRVRAVETLFDLVTGDEARIVRIRGNCRGRGGGIRQRLLDMGIVRGAVLRVERHAPLGDPVEVSVKGYCLALRMNEARHVEVERT